MECKKRLIDGNKAQAVLVNMAEHLMEAGNPEMAGAVGYAAEVIGKQPTVDAMEVVPCEKCLYSSQYSDENGCYKCGGLQTEDGDLVLMVKPDFFCAFGKQRGKGGAKMDGGNGDA